MNTLTNGSFSGEEASSPSAEAELDIIPEAEIPQKGVSVRYVKSSDNDWYVLRASYGREVRARDLLIDMGLYAYVAQRYEMKEVGGKRKKVLVSLLPNLIFAYMPRRDAAFYVKGPSPSFIEDYKKTSAAERISEDRLSKVIELSSLISFYYNHFAKDDHDAEKNPPLVIDSQEMLSFIRATSTKSSHLKNVDLQKCRFLDDQMVEVVQGNYKGVKGRIARVAGQQCIVVSLANGKWNISTDYIPTPFIRLLK
jgi:transcription antitermination factor NusG